MIGVEAERDPVQKPPPPLGTLDPQPVHRRNQPDHSGDATQCNLTGAFVVNLHLPGIAALRGGLHLVGLSGGLQDPAQLPTERLGLARHVGSRSPPQSASRRKQRHRLQDIGLASAIVAMDGHGPRIQMQIRPQMRAEVRDEQGSQCQHGPSSFQKYLRRRPGRKARSNRGQTRIGMTT